MGIWMLLNIYLFQLVVSVPSLALILYFIHLKYGKRKAIIKGIQGFLWACVPIIGLLFTGATIYIIGGDYIKEWIKNDPTSPENVKNPDFIPPSPKKKKEKEFKPINSRSEILDL